MASKIPRKLRELQDVDTSAAVPGDALVLDVDGETWVPGAGGGGGGSDDQTAAEVPVTPAGGIAATDVQAALEELDAEKASSSEVTSAIAAHAAAADPHTGYQKESEKDQAGGYVGLDGSSAAVIQDIVVPGTVLFNGFSVNGVGSIWIPSAFVAVGGVGGEVGFFGQTPDTQPAEPTTINEIVAALEALGLVA